MSSHLNEFYSNPYFQLCLAVLNGYFSFLNFANGSNGWGVFAAFFAVLCFYNFFVALNKRV